ncbi:hypothetical protein AVEN_143199-1 [Araneus ventricosus]|uniref:Tc1-like transposase DDE domain-containing protein n=1 Tax=Araneus ventricosus TaxID=182803 RepID=A0A4Y2ADA9_ARAVE|nr:hypothetical protein AVEN_143199-1 [Araneus ventricosus]
MIRCGTVCGLVADQPELSVFRWLIVSRLVVSRLWSQFQTAGTFSNKRESIPSVEVECPFNWYSNCNDCRNRAWGSVLSLKRSVSAHYHRDEVVEPYVRLFRRDFRDDFIFMGCSARSRTAQFVDDFLEKEGILRLVWPTRLPHHGPIEHVWDTLGRAIQPSLRTFQGLKSHC